MKHEKVSPGLLTAWDAFQSEGRSGLIPHTQVMGLFSAEESPKPPRTVVFLHCAPDARLDHLDQYGVRVNQDAGGVRTAFLPLEALDAISEDPSVDRIVESRYLRLLMDVAPGAVKLPAFLTGTGAGLTGAGVVIGTVDTGIDPNHPEFVGRILRIWDQTLPGPGVPEGTYGAELTGPLLTVSRDTEGHGTHVAGIAAGAHGVYGGVAPGAQLVIVKSDLQDAHIADGIRYIFRVAHDLGRPAVVNLSLGGHWDAHDGTDSLSQIVDAESGQGRIVCCAAGNEGNDNIHAQTVMPANTSRTVRFRVPASSAGNATRSVVLNGWYPGNDHMEVSIASPGGFFTPYQAVIAAGQPLRIYNLPDARVRVITPGPDPANGDHNFLMQISAAGGSSAPVTAGIWKLRLRTASIPGGGRVNVWCIDDGQRLDAIFTGTSVQDRVKVGSPGAATSAVTVASYTTKVQWIDIDLVPRQVGLAPNTISDFSSEGPRRDGAQKPDVTAPGAMIVSALSADSLVKRSNMATTQHLVMAGTSMATPFITGLVALLLQRQPTLGPAAIKALLRNHSHVPGSPAGSFDPKWGFGLIDATNV